jgi:hypothetical protein
MSGLANAAIIFGSIVGVAFLVHMLLHCRDGWREGMLVDTEDEDFGTLRPPEPSAPVKYEFTE